MSASTFGTKLTTANQTFVDEDGKTKLIQGKDGKPLASVDKDENGQVSSVNIGATKITRLDENEPNISPEEKKVRQRNNRNMDEYSKAIEKGDLQFIDISHQVARHNIQQAAYIFKNAYSNYPAGTLHFIGVHKQLRYPSELIAIKKDGYIFIGVNDGFFSLVFDDAPIDMVKITIADGSKHLFDLPTLVNSAKHLLTGKNLYELGPRPIQFVERSAFNPPIEDE